MRYAAAFLLVLLLLLLSVPVVLAGMEMDPCPACPADGMTAGWGLCFVLSGAVALFLARLRQPLTFAPENLRLLLLARSPDRPPRRV